MGSNTFSLRINNPCSQNWDEMSKEEQGRFCGHCSKTVVDFTNMSDSQIKDFFNTNKGKVCGRFHTSQLNRTFSVKLYKAPWYAASIIRYALSTLLTLKVADTFSNQPQNVKAHFSVVEDQTTFSSRLAQHHSPAKDTMFIEGKVLGDNNRTLKGVSVTLSETGQTMLTKGDGKFKFQLPKNFTGSSITLVFSHPEYRSTDYYVDLTSPKGKIVVRMPVREFLMGDVMEEKE